FANLSDSQLQQQLDDLSAARAQLQAQLKATDSQLTEALTEIEELQVQREQLQSKQQQLMGQQSSLEHLLQAAQAENWPQAVRLWIKEQGLEPLGQVRDLLQVNDAWQLATEQVVASWLDAWVLEEHPQHWPEHLGAKLVILQQHQIRQESLAQQVSGPLRQWSLLNSVICRSGTALASNDSEEAVINHDGQCWSAGGYQAPQVAAENSQIAQQQELQSVISELQSLEQKLTLINEALSQKKSKSVELQQL